MSYTLVKKLLNLCSRMIILPCPKRKAKALRVKHFFIRNVKNRFTHEEQDYSELAGMSDGFSELWKLLARCPAVSWFPVSLNLRFCCWCFKTPLNSEECLSQHLWGSAQWGFLSRVRPTEVTESQWKQRRSHEKPHSRKHHQEHLSQFMPLCTSFPSQRTLPLAYSVEHP